jgi:hypothetical protein
MVSAGSGDTATHVLRPAPLRLAAPVGSVEGWLGRARPRVRSRTMLERTVARWRSPQSARHQTWNHTPWAVTDTSQISPGSQRPSTSDSTALPGVRSATLSR